MNKDLLSKVCDLAVKVGQYQAEQRKTFSGGAVETKRSHDYVSYVDKESERMIVAALRKLLPEAGFITEEKTTEQDCGDREYEWIIDPLDGTTNYIHDLGPYCVCIALRHGAELVLGAVYEVTRGELFYAEKGGASESKSETCSELCREQPDLREAKGGGAWLRTADGTVRRLHVSPVNDIDQALVCIGYPYDADKFRQFCTQLTARLYGHCASIRSFGSAEAELCYVAAGRLEIYLESFLNPWDVSAGAIILKEAGGTITDYQGEDKLWPSGREVLATNGVLHRAMVKEIDRCRQNEVKRHE